MDTIGSHLVPTHKLARAGDRDRTVGPRRACAVSARCAPDVEVEPRPNPATPGPGRRRWDSTPRAAEWTSSNDERARDAAPKCRLSARSRCSTCAPSVGQATVNEKAANPIPSNGRTSNSQGS